MNLTNDNSETILGVVLLFAFIIAIAVLFTVVFDKDDDKPSFS
jgi:hypothetical protein